MSNRILEQYGSEIAQICGQTEQILEQAGQERRFTVVEYLSLMSLSEIVESFRMDLKQPCLSRRMDEISGSGNHYRLPLLDTEEYILIRNLLENYHGADPQKGKKCMKTLKKLKRHTKTIIQEKGCASVPENGSAAPEGVFQEYFRKG